MLIVNTAVGQPVRVCDKVLQSGEELIYKVKWQFFRLGTITIRTERDNSSTDSTLYKLTMLVESNPEVPFVKIREYYESLVSMTNMMSKCFYARQENGKERLEIRLAYDGQHSRAFYAQTDLNSGVRLRNDTLQNVSTYVDGPSLFFFTRWMSKSKQVVRVPTVVEGKKEETMLDFTLGREYIEIDACSEPIRTRKYAGYANWQGGTSAGLSGEFVGWISDDTAAIPMQAEMKILLGSIRLELEQWNRPGWTPPYYTQAAAR